ncbi:MAG: hypothetical protein HY883_00265 [Deltaproteobacteria bacterium]|nr:hypothetical protein [Deltaproteobacteria bacterium]
MESIMTKKGSSASYGFKTFIFLCMVLFASAGCTVGGKEPPRSAAPVPAAPVAAAAFTAPHSEGVLILAGEKSLGEQFAGRIKDNYKKETDQYKNAEVRYYYAKASFDAWIAQIKTDLAEGTDINDSFQYKALLQGTSNKIQALTGYINGVYAASSNPAKVVKVGDIPAELADAGTRISQEWQGAGQGRREEIKSELDSLIWKSFDEI